MRPSTIAWLACGAVMAGLATYSFIAPPRKAVPVTTDATDVVTSSAIGGAFTLINQNGETVTEKSWPGKYKLMYFGFTHCPDVCPLGLGIMADALKNVPSDMVDSIQPVFVSVDPKRDTPQVLKEYVTHFDKRLVGLTGTPAQIAAIKKAYKVYAEKAGDGADYMVNHSSFTYLMKPDNTLAAIFPHNTTPDDMAAGIKKALKP